MKTPLFLVCALLATAGSAQQFMTRAGSVSFHSSTPVEDISAENAQMSAVLNTADGGFAFQVPIRGFHFEKALMEEHFNENYMESEKFPNATFKGNVVGWSNAWADGKPHQVQAKGKLSVHGVEVERTIPATIQNKGGKWVIQARFEIPTKDHKISIPEVVREKIAASIPVTVDCTLDPR